MFTFFQRKSEEKEKQAKAQAQANQEHHRLVMQKIDNLIKYDTRPLSNKHLWTVIKDIWDLIDHSATVCGKGDYWAEDELFRLNKLFRDYDLRVEIYISRLLDAKGDEILDKLDKI